MYLPFDTLPENSRLWIYQSDSAITEAQRQVIADVLMAFTENWEVHGKPMAGSFQILDDYFVVIAADEQTNAASGCSIDDSVRVIRTLGQKVSLDFFNRNNIVLKTGDGLTLLPLAEVKRRLNEKTLSGGNQTFNTLAQVKSDLQNRWLVSLSDTWLKRFLPQESLSH
jgi:hypothetical protein